MAAYGLSPLDVQKAIDVQKPAGNLTTNSREAIVSIDTRVLSAKDVEAVPIKSTVSAGGSPQVVSVRDVAHVVDSYFERRSAYHFLNHAAGTKGISSNAIEVSVIQNPGASSAYVVPAVMEIVRQIERDNPGVKFTAAYSLSL